MLFRSDLKPEHIRVREADGQPVLLDFGVGWYEGAPPVTTGPLPPATQYLLSPEAVRFLWHSSEHSGTRYSCQPADDLYALGVCLYRATTGHYPFSEWMPRGVLLNAIVHAQPLAPRLVNPRVPGALSEVIARLLAKDSSQRYPNGEALHEALVAAARSEEPAWEGSIFEYEEVAPDTEGAASKRHILRPERPKLAWPTSPPPRVDATRRGHWRLRLVLAAALLLVLVPVTRLEREAHVPREAWSTDVRMDPDSAPSEPAPPPAREQKRAPCTRGLEVELSDACWHRLWQRPPDCPRQTIAYKGMCLWPVPRPPAVPTSVDGGSSEER